MQEGNEEPFNIRLHLAKDILTIQEQDVICVSGEPFYSSVSEPVWNMLCTINKTLQHRGTESLCQWQISSSLPHKSNVAIKWWFTYLIVVHKVSYSVLIVSMSDNFFVQLISFLFFMKKLHWGRSLWPFSKSHYSFNNIWLSKTNRGIACFF